MGGANTVAILISAGAQLDLQNKHGATALMLAAYYGHLSTASLLIEAGANITLQEHAGATALAWASANGHLYLAERLRIAKKELDKNYNIANSSK